MVAPRIRRTEGHFAGAQGPLLYRRAWLPRDPRGALVLVHGYAEHTGRYESLGAWFAARGCAVHGYDQRGHGRSTGHRCHVRRFSDFLDDLDAFIDRVRGEHPGLPLTVVGHSMGGLVVLAFARERPGRVDGAVISAPALGVARTVPRLQALGLRLARRVVPRFDLERGVDPEGLSRDPEVVRAYVADPYVYSTITLSLAAELYLTSRRTASGAGDLRDPILMLHGEADPICSIRDTREFFEGIPHERKRLIAYPDLRHEIFNEPEHLRVFEDIWEWLEVDSPQGLARTG